VKLEPELNISPSTIENYLINKVIDFEEYNFSNLTNLSKLDLYKNKIKFLLVQRKHSFSYVDLIRGKYNQNNKTEIKNLLSLMSKEELDNILSNDFDFLWNNLWKKTSKYKIYEREADISREKFKVIKSYDLVELIDFDNLYETPEWGFPKGRKDKNERNIDCAIREFREETAITQDKYLILNRLNTIEETVVNEDKVYKLVYYLGLLCEESTLEINNDAKYEIGDLKWLSFEDVIQKIRPYFTDKLKMIYKIYFLFINLIENIQNKENIETNFT
jgi:8-oxo-dGTP pyrophosphatase MutT (NUDIX family)